MSCFCRYLFFLVMAMVSGAALAGVNLQNGDIVVVNPSTDSLIQVNPSTGVQTLIASGGLMVRPEHVAYSPDGNIIVMNDVDLDERGWVIKIDPMTGTQSLIDYVSDPYPGGITVAKDGIIWATEEFGVEWFDPVTGDRGAFTKAFGDNVGGGVAEVSIGGLRRIVVTNVDDVTTFVSIDPTGDPLSDSTYEIVATSGVVESRTGIDVNFNGSVVSLGEDSIFETNLETGVTTTLFSGGLLTGIPEPGRQKNHISVSPGGDIFVTKGSEIIGVNQGSGSQYVVSSGGLLTDVWGIAVVQGPSPMIIDIDIKPNNDDNAVNPTSNQKIAVAILTTDSFDATQVNWETVRFGAGGATESHGRPHIEDVEGDGDMDLLLHFSAPETGIACGDTETILTGETYDDQPITGADSIRTVPCK